MNLLDTLQGSLLEGFYPAGWDLAKIDACCSHPAQSVTERQPHWNPAFTPLPCQTVADFDAMMGHEIALQIAASAPRYLKAEDIPADVLEHEAGIARTRAKEEGKPDAVLEKIVQGRLEKFKDEVVLSRQAYVRDESITVEKLILQNVAAIGDAVAMIDSTPSVATRNCAIAWFTCNFPANQSAVVPDGPPYTIECTDLSYAEQGQPIATWIWEFGDGNTSTLRNPLHSFTDPGKHTVRLTVTTQCGRQYTNTTTAGVSVYCAVPEPGFTTGVTEGFAPLTVQVSDSSRHTPEGITTWTYWQDNTPVSNERNPVFTYNTPGTYTISQTVRKDCVPAGSSPGECSPRSQKEARHGARKCPGGSAGESGPVFDRRSDRAQRSAQANRSRGDA